jgi:RNA polymerase sigma-70 factor (ECF subfamily)
MSSHEGDRALAGRMLRGEEDAFEQFFQENLGRLFRFAMTRMDHDPQAAEEVVQECLCQAVTRIETYRGEASLFTWLCTICRHQIHRWRERRGSRWEAVELTEDAPEIRAALESLDGAAEPGPQEALRRREVGRLVQVTLDALPAAYGNALEWKYIQGLSVKEIAARLRLGPKAAESLLSRAREAFRDGFAALTGGRSDDVVPG